MTYYLFSSKSFTTVPEKNAEDAIQGLNGTVIGKQTVRLSWGRSTGNKQWRGDSNNQWNGGRYGGQSYGGYGGYYSVPQHQDPNMHPTAAAAAVNGSS
uniref:RRM domain-containing protein n=1 Tax=Cucumis sativus TaxID=3659 RepID=A0A0A0LKZ0_CUCSA